MDTHLLTLAILATVVQYVAGADFHQVCYTGLGCFNNSAPFNNAGGKVPDPPYRVGISHQLYTRTTRDNPEALNFTMSSSSTFDSSKLTKVVIHGFQNSASSPWVVDFKDALLNKGDFNVLVVGWGGGAAGLDYAGSAANTRLVAMDLKLVLDMLQKNGLDLADVHLIGHSLGAHISGQVGGMLGGRVGRISGMDPAQPDFENKDPAVRLDNTDAVFVDVMHTDAVGDHGLHGGYGLMQASGDVDFYVNGGGPQPGCDGKDGIDLSKILDILGKKRAASPLDGLEVSCSHSRSHDLFLESIISDCHFTGYPCSSWTEFQAGHCLDCSKGGCATAGYPATSGNTGSKYLMTHPASPFCGVHYRLYLDVHDSVVNRTDGTLYVSLVGDKGETAFVRVTDQNQHMTGNTVVNKIQLFDKEVGDITTIKVKYVKNPSFIAHGKTWIYISAVNVVNSQSGKTFTTCDGKYALRTNQAESLPAKLVDQSTPTSCFDASVFA